MLDLPFLSNRLNLNSGKIDGGSFVERRLSDLRGAYHDADAFEAALNHDDPVIYTVSACEPADGEGDLHYGLGIIQPGKIGEEYHLTKGHLHSWRPAAEIYLGLRGEGMMLLEDEATGESKMVPLITNRIVYVPGHTGHRTVNTGTEPLTYIGVYPARAGHDYGALAERNFRYRIVDRDGEPTLMERAL